MEWAYATMKEDESVPTPTLERSHNSAEESDVITSFRNSYLASSDTQKNIQADPGKQYQQATRISVLSTHLQTNAPLPELSLVSYKWRSNSCFIDTMLELFFRGYIALPYQSRLNFARTIRSLETNSGIKGVLEHFLIRAQAMLGPSSNGYQSQRDSMTALQSSLAQGQQYVQRLIVEQLSYNLHAPGMPGCPRTWFTQLIQVRNIFYYPWSLTQATHFLEGSNSGE